MNKIALITGATSGIGQATALKAAEAGFDVIITGRRNDRLQKLAESIRQKGADVLPLTFDIRQSGEVETAIRNLGGNGGISLYWSIMPVWQWGRSHPGGCPRRLGKNDRYQCKGPVIHHPCCSPLMIARNTGHIVNLASIAGKEVYPGGNVYCATKHAVDALSRAMRTDMLKHHIKVTNIAPGMVETEFSIVRYKGDKEAADKVYQGMTPVDQRGYRRDHHFRYHPSGPRLPERHRHHAYRPSQLQRRR